MERLFCENCGAFLLEYDIEGLINIQCPYCGAGQGIEIPEKDMDIQTAYLIRQKNGLLSRCKLNEEGKYEILATNQTANDYITVREKESAMRARDDALCVVQNKIVSMEDFKELEPEGYNALRDSLEEKGLI